MQSYKHQKVESSYPISSYDLIDYSNHQLSLKTQVVQRLLSTGVHIKSKKPLISITH